MKTSTTENMFKDAVESEETRKGYLKDYIEGLILSGDLYEFESAIEDWDFEGGEFEKKCIANARTKLAQAFVALDLPAKSYNKNRKTGEFSWVDTESRDSKLKGKALVAAKIKAKIKQGLKDDTLTSEQLADIMAILNK